MKTTTVVVAGFASRKKIDAQLRADPPSIVNIPRVRPIPLRVRVSSPSTMGSTIRTSPTRRQNCRSLMEERKRDHYSQPRGCFRSNGLRTGSIIETECRRQGRIWPRTASNSQSALLAPRRPRRRSGGDIASSLHNPLLDNGTDGGGRPGAPPERCYCQFTEFHFSFSKRDALPRVNTRWCQRRVRERARAHVCAPRISARDITRSLERRTYIRVRRKIKKKNKRK